MEKHVMKQTSNKLKRLKLTKLPTVSPRMTMQALRHQDLTEVMKLVTH